MELREYGRARGLDVMVYAVLCRRSRSKVEYWAENLRIGCLEGAVGVRGVGDLGGQVGRSSSDEGGGKAGGVDETAIGHVDEEVEVGEEVSTNDGGGDIGHDEVPLVFTASEG